MSLKSFLQMQEGGQTFVSPFAQPDPTGTTKAVTPRQRPNLTFEAVTGINRKDTSPTIKIGDQPEYLPIGPGREYKEKKPENFDPGVGNNISVHGYNAQSPEVTAAAAAMNIQVTGFENAAFYDTLVAMNQPETPLSRGLDKYVGPFMPITPKGTLGASLGLIPVVGPAALSVQRSLTGEPIFGTSKAATPATTSKAATPPTTSKAATPPTTSKAATEAARQGSIAAGEAMLGSAPAPAATPVSVGQDIFGVAYGQGGEISPSFAIGGKGSFTSFGHYGAGVSQADESNIISTGINNGVFGNSQSGKDAVDTMVSNGYNEVQITAVASGMGTEGKPDYDIGGVGDPGKVICQELYDQGLLEHSIYSLDEQFGEYLRKHDLALLEGYHAWAYNVVNAMRKSKTITHIVRIVSRPVVKHIAYKMGHPSKTLLGAAMFNVGAFICRRLAKKEIVYA
jgi:hypothetical protein